MKTVWVRLLLMLVIGLTPHGVSADGIVAIGKINAAPVDFDDKEVRLRGIAQNPTRLPLIDLKSYVLKDASGEIMILTESDLPKMNEEITIRVRIKSVAIIRGEALGLTALELERYDQLHEL
ncbi:hypothetical protein ABF87_00405 [Nitrosomonas sp. JL21]|uniref:hypothetical protein n=1 Tax=Nitrosomonas sp. JL21 TaxID=153949 RepID=UPI00136DE694|nr:hypothetical protein [Nitrosomonas sp. JL21]MBL8496650.1 hypothetical protein [Nitrosomonas sp.]MCC7091039.1 hypothetical protein [Nitrosomonas sp.]MXS76436.1 hypothetical protein [Nitrosomonas sp. JL21]